MKYSVIKFATSLFLILLISCKKSNQDIVPNPIGRWEASKTIIDLSEGTFSPGNGNIFEFETNTFIRLVHNGQGESGSYKIIKEQFEGFSYRLIFNNNYNGLKYFLKMEGNYLIIGSNDIYKTSWFYIRIL